jgi:hypothetical protein
VNLPDGMVILYLLIDPIPCTVQDGGGVTVLDAASELLGSKKIPPLGAVQMLGACVRHDVPARGSCLQCATMCIEVNQHVSRFR